MASLYAKALSKRREVVSDHVNEPFGSIVAHTTHTELVKHFPEVTRKVVRVGVGNEIVSELFVDA